MSVISRYERDEMIPSIDTAKKLVALLDTTVGYLVGENENADTFKNPDMLKRFKDILSFPKDKQEHILFALDSVITRHFRCFVGRSANLITFLFNGTSIN